MKGSTKNDIRVLYLGVMKGLFKEVTFKGRLGG